MANIYDIARVAGVSPTTVSLVLNGRGSELRVAKKTQELVLRTAKELNYVPNVSARRLMDREKEESAEIGLFWSPDQHADYLGDMIRKLSEMQENGEIRRMNVTIYPFENGHIDRMDKVLKSSYAHGFVIPMSDEADRIRLEEMDIRVPVILLYQESERFYEVSVDNCRNGILAAELFLKRGLKKLAYIGNLNPSLPALDRRKGFTDRLKEEEGINLSILSGEDVSGSGLDDFSLGQRLSGLLCEKKEVPQGIFAQNEIVANGIVNGLKRNGIRVPEDTAVIGYGVNSHENREEEKLTLITFPAESIAENTWKMMDMLIRREEPEKRQILCESEIYYGSSFPENGKAKE